MQIDLEIRYQLPFIQFHNARNGSKGSQVTYNPNKVLQHRVSKLTLPTFDGSGKMIAQAWIQKLDTYFSQPHDRGGSHQVCSTFGGFSP